MAVHFAVFLQDFIQPGFGIGWLVETGLGLGLGGMCDLEFNVVFVVAGFGCHLEGKVGGVVLLVERHVAAVARTAGKSRGAVHGGDFAQALVFAHDCQGID